jgi:hypothetical protein
MALPGFSIPGGDVGPVALAGDRVIFPFADSGGGDCRKVGVLDLSSNSETVVA